VAVTQKRVRKIQILRTLGEFMKKCLTNEIF